MLSIGKLVVGQQRYYEAQVAHGQDDYYSGRGEAPGEWVGGGARALGLEGRVSADAFNALIAGRDPRAHTERLRDGPEPKVAALDLTFSAPKSVSVLFAIGGDDIAGELVGAHESAVRAAVGWIEDSAVLVRRGPQGHVRLPGEGLIAAAYRHRMSRALDPQLHTHVVAANLTRGPDGRFTSLFGAPIYQAAKTAGYLYQAHLRAEITARLGLDWGPVRKGAAELVGVPREAVEEFSRRRHEMQRAAEDGGFSLGTKRSAEAAAVDTRDRKQYGIDTHTWREEVRARAAEYGLGQDEVSHLLARGAEQLQTSRPLGAEVGKVTSDIVELGERLVGPTGLTEQSNTFDEREVLQAFAQAAAEGAPVRTLRGWADWFTGQADVLRVDGGAMTTVDLVECERRLIAMTAGRAREGCGLLPAGSVENALATADRPLTSEQQEVVRACAASGHGVDVVEALAGTGKTFTARVLRSLYEDAGYTVLGVAPTGRGARELSDEAGIPAWTIDRMLIEIEQHGLRLPARTVVVLDEAGMAATRLTARLLRHVATVGAKVIAIGDSGQLASVLAGGWLRAVGEQIGALRLTEVLRQRDPAERRALAALHDGLPDRYLEWALRTDRIEVLSVNELAQQAVSEWMAAATEVPPGQAVMIARDNGTRALLNQFARARRAAAGELGDELFYGRTSVSVGDRVICRHNDAWVDVDNGTRGTVRHVGEQGIVLDTDSGAVRELPAGYVADHVEHAYCLTGHGMQGATVDRAVVVAYPRDLTAGWSYTALSRARDVSRVLIANADRDDMTPTAEGPGNGRADAAVADVITRVARRMLVRDGEDLAVSQLPPAGHEADSSLGSARRLEGAVPQERPAERAEPIERPANPGRLAALRAEVERLEAVREGLATAPLDRFDDLEERERELAQRIAARSDRLTELGAPPRRFAGRDRHGEERSFLQAAIELDEQVLATVRTNRAQLRRELGDPDQVRSERHSVEDAIAAARAEHSSILRELTDRAIADCPDWLVDVIGQRPASESVRSAWHQAARSIAAYRLDYGVTDPLALGPEPPHSNKQHDAWLLAHAAIEPALLQLGRQQSIADHGIDLGRS